MKTVAHSLQNHDELCLPPLTTEQRASLRESIRAEGIHSPILQDQHGQVIDGLERLSIAEELGLRTYPVRTIHCADDRIRRHLRLQLNCNRRQLTRKQKRQIIAQELARCPDLSDRYIGSVLGASHRTVAVIRTELERTGQIAHLPVKLGLDGKRRRLPVIPTETKAQAARAAQVLRSITVPPSRPMKLAAAERLARNEKLQLANNSLELPGSVEIFCSDFRKLKLPDLSIDLIFTDPPWYQPTLYGDLARFAARVLKPGRLCCVYTSSATLPSVIDQMGKYLDYYWCLAVGYQNAHCHRNAIVSFTVTWTPVLVFGKGSMERRAKSAPLDFFSTSCGRTDKSSYHTWQQEGQPARYWLERLTLPGDVILDPCSGSGQFPLEAYQIGGRRVIACDIDSEAAAITRGRLARASNPDGIG